MNLGIEEKHEVLEEVYKFSQLYGTRTQGEKFQKQQQKAFRKQFLTELEEFLFEVDRLSQKYPLVERFVRLSSIPKQKKGGEMKEFLNESLFRYQARYGTEFNCERCDFRAPVFYENVPKKVEHLMSDIAEMISYHISNIHPDLRSFSGYDCINFKKKIKNKGDK